MSSPRLVLGKEAQRAIRRLETLPEKTGKPDPNDKLQRQATAILIAAVHDAFDQSDAHRILGRSATR